MTADPLESLAGQPAVLAALAAARSSVDTLLGHRLLRRRSAELSAEAGLRCARASAALAGHDVPLDDVRSGERAARDPVVQGALRVSTGLGELVDVVERAPLQALARLHMLAARGLSADGADGADAELGRPRGDALVSARLAGLADLIAGRHVGSGLLLAAVVHGEILALEAFPAANGVVARGAGRLILVTRGVDPKAVSAPDVGHWELRAGYVAAAAEYAGGDPVPWVLHYSEAVRLGAVESLAVCEAFVRTAEAQA